MEWVSYAGVATDVVCILMCAVFYMAVFQDKKNMKDTELLLLMFTLESLILAADVMSWYVNNDEDLEVLNRVARYTKNILLFAFTIIFWNYLKQSVDAPPKVEKICEITVFILFLIGILLICTNVLTGWLFSFDDGKYVRGDHLFDYYAAMILMLATGCIEVLLSDTSPRNKFSTVIYLIITVSLTLVQYFKLGLSLIYVAPLFILIIIHINMYLSRCEEIAQLQAELKADRYELMISQVQPHFLYNALTSIMVIEDNPPKTVEAIGEFSNVLRMNLNKFGTEEPVTFQSELDHAESYLYLEKLRFKDKLNVVWEIENTQFMFPPMTLQPLIENAVRHGITLKPGGGTVTISCKLVDKGHLVEIMDDGLGFDTEEFSKMEKTASLGLNNVANRVAQFVGGTMEVKSSPGQGTTVSIFVPFGGRRKKNSN